MKIKFETLTMLLQTLDAVSTKGIKTESVLNILDLKAELSGKAKTMSGILGSIMEEYGVSAIDNKYDWSGVENADEIRKRVNDFYNTEIDIQNVNNIEPGEIVKLFEGQSLSTLYFVMEYLKK